ncbi:MAG: nucleotide exchange factor GrpE [Elusimicrobiota bacterium]
MSLESEERPELAEKLSELDILKQSVDELKLKERATYDQLLRQTADFQNFRKRNEQKVIESRQAGKEDVLTSIISLADTLLSAELASQNATDMESLKRGLTLVREQFEKFLSEQGLVAIKAKGEKLNPDLHDVIASVVDNSLEEGTIVDEIQRGFTLNDRMVRPARVRVSTKPQEVTPTKGNQEEK